jgi:NAD(P)-dependent dehydrogenase (short-subunit alcohol dehydrogenase family)
MSMSTNGRARERRLEGRVALVTGATSGLGQAIAAGFAGEGARVAICGRREEIGQAVAAEIRQGGGEAIFLTCDVADGEQVRELVARTVAAFGRLDIAVNNAGLGAAGAKLADLTEEEFDSVLATNLRGVWLCMKHEIKQFQAQGDGGCIINMGSVLGRVALATGAQYSAAHYVAAKHGIEGLTKTAAADYGREGIRVNTLAPGVVATAISEHVITDEAPLISRWRDRIPLGRLAAVADVVGAAVFLASPDAGYMSGTSLVVDGGFLAQ